MRIPSKRRVAIVRGVSRGVGYVCFLGGAVIRNRSLRVFGLRAVAERALLRGRFEVANRYADELLDWARLNPNNWNCGNAMHYGHLIRGRVAFEQKDLDRACAELLASAQTLGSPQLNSFGPNMQLAESLLLAGRGDGVLQYLERCGSFWELGGPQLQQWESEIRQGKTPIFGGNLVF